MEISRLNAEVCASRESAAVLRRLIAAAALFVAATCIETRGIEAQEPANDAHTQEQASPARAYPVRLRHGVDREDRKLARRLGNQSPISPGPAGAHLTYYGGP